MPDNPTKREHSCPVSVCFNKDGVAKLLYCGQWSCKECRKRLANKWALRVYFHIQQAHSEEAFENGTNNGDFFFITFTLRGYIRTAQAGFAVLPKLWNTFRMRMQRHYKGFDYIAFVEGQPKRSKIPHFHIISSRPLPLKPGKKGQITKRSIHDFAMSIGFGHQADMQAVGSKLAAHYVAKYATKQSDETPKGFRRVRASRKWLKLPKDPDKILIVKLKGETVPEFIARASALTGRTEAELYADMITLWAQHHEGLPDLRLRW